MAGSPPDKNVAAVAAATAEERRLSAHQFARSKGFTLILHGTCEHCQEPDIALVAVGTVGQTVAMCHGCLSQAQRAIHHLDCMELVREAVALAKPKGGADAG
jgi:hypothetical protein